MTLEGKSELFQILAPPRNQPLETARTALAEFGQWLGDDDTNLSPNECRTLIAVAMELVDDQPHGLDCPRNHDDFACTCHLDRLYSELSDALGGLL